jgi:DNA-binding NarL/FixJ family response regulator
MNAESMNRVPTGVFLLVDDDELVTKALARHLSLIRPCVTATTCASAREKLAEHRRPFSGFVFDLRLPDGNGLELLREARKYAPDVPALILTGEFDRAVVNEAYRLGGVCLLKPAGRGELARFTNEAVAAELGIDAVIRARIAQIATDYQVTAPEMEILIAKIAGLSAEELMEKRGITRNTYKTQVRTLLSRLGVDSLEDARRKVLQVSRD